MTKEYLRFLKEGKKMAYKCYEVINEVKKYILSNNDWIYYFMIDSKGDNEKIFQIMEEHPTEWKEYINLEVYSINPSGIVQVALLIDDDTEYGAQLSRYIHISHFSEDVEKNKLKYQGDINKYMKENIQREITHLEQQIEEKKQLLKEYE